ncbi:MAG: ABC transporter permease [Anaerolineales bacterium]|jgi:putative ABC transport system permease protein
MNIGQSILEAIESLLSNKLRSALTVLGVVIGVGAVIAMLSIGAGAQETIAGSINDIGTNLLFVVDGGDSEVVRNPKPLTEGDAEALADPFAAPSVLRVAPIISGWVEVSFGGESTFTTIEGVTPAYSVVRNVGVVEGEFISELHQLGRSAVVVLGQDVAEELFGRTQALIGETIRLEGQPFRVIGVAEEKGGSSFSNEDNRVIVPLSTLQARLIRRGTADAVDVILVQATTADAVPQASEEITVVLRSRHRTPIGEDDFTIFTQQEFLDAAATVTRVLTVFLGGIAAISLLVGGIGIMNIMLVSVTERTREIGLRKAVGARKRDIMLQFLTESSMLSLAGGFIGILLGWGLSEGVGAIAAASNTELNPLMSLDSVLLATLFSFAVGLFFGIYPAKRAADLEPAEALRYE